MTQLIKLDDRAKRLSSVFTQNSAAMTKMVPRTLGDPTRLLRIAFNNVAYDTGLLEVAATERGLASILGGVMEALKLGLTIGGPAQECWLIPFKEKGTPVATLIIGYQGYRNILDRAKSVIALHPRAVYLHDEFDVNFGTQKIHHKPYWLLGEKEPGELVAVYAIANLQRGGVQIEVMPKREIDEHRAKSRAKDSGPWRDYYDAMALKTVIRKIAKYLPKSSELLLRALDLDDKADRGVPQDFEVSDFIIPPEESVKQVGHSGLQKLKEAAGVATPDPIAQATASVAEAVAKANEERERYLAEPEPKVTVVAGSNIPPAEPPSEEALRELDEALGAEPDEDNHKLDAEIAAKEAPMTPVGDFALTPQAAAPIDTAKAAVEALRRRSEEIARKRQGR